MIRILNLLKINSFILAVFFTCSVCISTFAQDLEDNIEIPEYGDSEPYQDYSDTENQNPDPEFMEEVEPGEFDQSDDTTELN